jgi:hypothetical protein
MLVRAKEMCIVNGFRRRPGAEFEYELGEGKSLPKFLESVAEVPQAKVLRPGDEIMIAGQKAKIPKTLQDHDHLRNSNIPGRASDKKVI